MLLSLSLSRDIFLILRQHRKTDDEKTNILHTMFDPRKSALRVPVAGARSLGKYYVYGNKHRCNQKDSGTRRTADGHA